MSDIETALQVARGLLNPRNGYLGYARLVDALLEERARECERLALQFSEDGLDGARLPGEVEETLKLRASDLRGQITQNYQKQKEAERAAL